jgi:sucrose-6F-phosphate phosphohydrolase
MKPEYLVISDVDGTLLGDSDALQRLHTGIGQLPCTIAWVYSSGRFVESVRRSVKQSGLPQPEAIIGGVGTEMLCCSRVELIRDWNEQWANTFSATRIQEVLHPFERLELQPFEYQSTSKVSYYLLNAKPSELQQIAQALAAATVDCQIIYSSGRDLDILPALANKGNSARYLAEFLGYTPDQVFVAGDSGNDLSMFQVGFRGIVVGNAAEELRLLRSERVFQASDCFAAGVLQGLQYWMQVDCQCVEMTRS